MKRPCASIDAEAGVCPHFEKKHEKLKTAPRADSQEASESAL
jgi:hypothetical protein